MWGQQTYGTHPVSYPALKPTLQLALHPTLHCVLCRWDTALLHGKRITSANRTHNSEARHTTPMPQGPSQGISLRPYSLMRTCLLPKK